MKTAPCRIRRTPLVLGLVVLALGPSEAWSAGAGGVPSDESAQQAFREGVDAARQAHWPEALALFERAYSLSPRPVVLINLAGAQARTGRLIAAAKNYHRILDDSTTPDTASFRRAAAEVLPELEQRIPKVRVHPTGHAPSDTFEIDGEASALDRLDAGVALDPGPHTLVVRRGGVERTRVLFSLAERESRDIPLAVPGLIVPPAAPAVAAVATGAALDLTPAPGSTGPREPERRWWASPWTWTGVGVVVVAATSAVLIVTLGRREQPFTGNIPPGQIQLQ